MQAASVSLDKHSPEIVFRHELHVLAGNYQIGYDRREIGPLGVT